MVATSLCLRKHPRLQCFLSNLRWKKTCGPQPFFSSYLSNILNPNGGTFIEEHVFYPLAFIPLSFHCIKQCVSDEIETSIPGIVSTFFFHSGLFFLLDGPFKHKKMVTIKKYISISPHLYHTAFYFKNCK